ncbi:universal stress protein [Enterococcus sp. BWR-S5]|uniref:universal stress protein n=1 Tax=Enterococcus sp. BWR-S5 TaxID=2787714 RepID=UPI0019235D86|nr:universal stress protein [Enterococcus sp. BWR-S5]MBL1226394.1 universal stress protein [Enterococcus sp. BWR-S5]
MMNIYEKILVAVDGSKNAELALKHAVALAVKNDAELYILSIIDEHAISHSSFAFSKVLAEEKELVRQEMEEHIDYAINQGLTAVKPIVEIGNPKEYISSSVPTEENVELIVIGATGKGRLTENSLGSTTSYVVQNAPCNVLVIKE